MTDYELLALIIAGLSFIASVFSTIISLIANGKCSSATLELSLRDSIRSADEKIMDCSADMDALLSKTDLTDEEKSQLDFKAKRFNAAVENYLNAYEEACAKYVDKKVDKDRFKKMYFSEIRKLVENEKFTQYFNPVTSRYKVTLKVYGEWYNLEK